jgi:DedD protein
MRFEIRSGGVLLILVGLAALSGAVFVLGLVAGYEIGSQNQANTSQLATTYPMPAPPAAAPSAPASPPAEAMNPATPAVSTPVPVVPPPKTAAPSEKLAAVKNRAPASPVAAAQPKETPTPASTREGLAAVRRSLTEGEHAATPAGAPATAASSYPQPPPTVERRVAAATPEPPLARRGYNIQIDAAMDLVGANEMVRRLRQLGYQPHLVEAQISGRTWYRIQVGPYDSEDEARAAQEKLREQYNSTFTAH